MEKRVSEIFHQGKAIVYGDYTGLKSDEFPEVIKE